MERGGEEVGVGKDLALDAAPNLNIFSFLGLSSWVLFSYSFNLLSSCYVGLMATVAN